MTKEKVIIILCDTLRAKSLPHYGSERNTTPKLDGIIEKDFTIYSRAYAPSSWTIPSHLSLFTGLHPSQVMETPTSLKLDPIFKTLSELFKDSGYKTCALSANELISRKLGFDKGFDVFLQLWLPDPEDEELMFSLEGNNYFEKLFTLIQLLTRKESMRKTLRGLRENMYKKFRNTLKDATPSTNRAMNLLKQYILKNSDQRLFCFVNLMQVHNIYNPPRVARNRFVKHNAEFEEYLKKVPPSNHYAVKPFNREFIEYIRGRYEEEILYLDIVISDFITFLKDSNLYDSSILVITSDHGEHFGENGHVAHVFSVFEPLIRIPLYIKWQGKSRHIGTVKDELVMLQDLYLTFSNLLSHWHPCPESSFDLTSSDKRQWIVSSLPDMSTHINGCREKRQTFSVEEIGLENESLTAYIFNDGTKVIENGTKFWLYDLKNDPDEVKPFSLSEKHLEMIGKVKEAVA